MASTRSLLRLAHGWTLVRGPSLSAALVREFIRPAVRAVPSSMARRLGSCRISFPVEVASGVASRWTMANGGLEVSVMTAGIEEHDVAMELLLCLGQVTLGETVGRGTAFVLDASVRRNQHGD